MHKFNAPSLWAPGDGMLHVLAPIIVIVTKEDFLCHLSSTNFSGLLDLQTSASFRCICGCNGLVA